MRSLLQRQINKHLGGEIPPGMEAFIAAVSASYNDHEERMQMLEHAMKLSSDELYKANKKLRDEAQSLRDVNNNLENILNSMNFEMKGSEAENFDPASYIKKQSAEIIRISRQREDLLKNLEKQNQELNDYAQVVSHDLKAPLRNINTLISWFKEDHSDVLNDQGNKTLNSVMENVERMDMLIRGILEYSSVEKTASDNHTVDLNVLVKDVLSTIHIPQSFNVTIATALPDVFGNALKFRQIFQNLIENAIKYNDKENGVINIGCIEDGSVYRFYVQDNGKGIPEAYFNKIFNIFTKLDNNDNSTGIGLSIVKKVLTLYGGTIWLKSKPGAGTCFYFTIPKLWNSQT